MQTATLSNAVSVVPGSELPAAANDASTTPRYARTIKVSKHVRWDIDADVIRGRRLDATRKFMPDGLSRVNQLQFLRPNEMRILRVIRAVRNQHHPDA